MSKTTIHIRTDGNHLIGLGHLVRCMALANMLKNNFSITFYFKDIPKAIFTELEYLGYICFRIDKEKEFIERLNINTIAVLDGYQFDSTYQKQIKATSAELVCIDDLHDKEFYADLIINHAPGIKPEDYMAHPYTQYALGPDYSLLRPAFLEQTKKKRKIEKIETVLICFGGSDYRNLTESTLQVILSNVNFKKIIVVTGSAHFCSDVLNLLINNDSRIVHYNSVDEKQMLSIMLESDLAIVPASGILLEVIAAGCIAISGMYAENQKFVYSNYKKTGYFIDAIDFNEVNLRVAINKSFKINVDAQKIIDGSSGKRLLKYFLHLELKGKMKLRKADKTDEKITYHWAANPLVRVHSFNKHIITEEEHFCWFQNKLSDIQCVFLIAEKDNLPIGSIRFDLKENQAIISYLIDPERHGNGLGQILLANGIKYILDTSIKNDLKKIVGFVMKSNIPSIKAFERLGFKKYEDDDMFKYEMLII